MTDPKLRGLDTEQVCAKLGGNKPLDRSTLWRRIQKDPDFPKPFYIWNNAPRFVEAEVDAYIARKIAERDDPIRAAARFECQQRRGQRLKAARAGEAAVKSNKHVSKTRSARKVTPPDARPPRVRAKRRAITEAPT
jgi:predicted DNA-binding transcriptional regulator AlpA